MKGLIEIKNGIYDVFLSGSMIINATDSTEVILRAENEPEALTFIFKFEDDEKDPNQPRKSIKVVNDLTLEIIFTNYNNSLGSFNKEIWYIGSIIDRKLYLNYVIFGFKDSKTKKIDYTFYLGEEVENG